MLTSLKLPFRFDPESLKADLARILPDEWGPHFNSRYYEGDWSGVALRSVGGTAKHIYPDPAASEPYADTPVLARCPYIRSVLAEIKCPTESVRLLRLGAGSSIREHKDYKLSFEDGMVRLHIPIATDPRVEFYVNNRRVVLNEGECWYINFNLPHRVKNGSDSDRIHLVIDCVVNDWLHSLLSAGDEGEASSSRGPIEVAHSNGGSQAGFEQFRQLVLEDLSLQKRLRETDDLTTFLALTVELGKERGYDFTAEEIEEARRASRTAWLQRWV